jgi:hypothetical protein
VGLLGLEELHGHVGRVKVGVGLQEVLLRGLGLAEGGAAKCNLKYVKQQLITRYIRISLSEDSLKGGHAGNGVGGGGIGEPGLAQLEAGHALGSRGHEGIASSQKGGEDGCGIEHDPFEKM